VDGSFEALKQWCQGVRRIRRDGDTADRAMEIAALLRQVTPTAKFAACRLDAQPRPNLAVKHEEAVGHNGAFLEQLRRQLGDFDTAQSAVVSFPLRYGETELTVLVAPVAHISRCHGFLVLGLAADMPEARRRDLNIFLDLAAELVRPYLELDNVQRVLTATTEAHRESADLVLVSDALGGIVHDLNNSLNSMMLQASLVQLKAAESLREDIAVIRHEGGQAAERLAVLQQFRELSRQSRSTTDLNTMVRDVLAADGEKLGHIQHALADRPLTLSTNTGALKRLIALLLRIASSAGRDAEIGVTTIEQNQRVQLVIEVKPGRRLDGETPAESSSVVGQIERLAAQSLARLTGAELTISVEPGTGGSLSAVWRASVNEL